MQELSNLENQKAQKLQELNRLLSNIRTTTIDTENFGSVDLCNEDKNLLENYLKAWMGNTKTVSLDKKLSLAKALIIRILNSKDDKDKKIVLFRNIDIRISHDEGIPSIGETKEFRQLKELMLAMKDYMNIERLESEVRAADQGVTFSQTAASEVRAGVTFSQTAAPKVRAGVPSSQTAAPKVRTTDKRVTFYQTAAPGVSSPKVQARASARTNLVFSRSSRRSMMMNHSEIQAGGTQVERLTNQGKNLTGQTTQHLSPK